MGRRVPRSAELEALAARSGASPPGAAGNCLAEGHVKATCTSPARCFNCMGVGHHERGCPLLPFRGRGVGKRGRSPGEGPGHHGVPAAVALTAPSLRTRPLLARLPRAERLEPGVTGPGDGEVHGQPFDAPASDGQPVEPAGAGGGLNLDNNVGLGGDDGAGPSRVSGRRQGYPRCLLRRIEEPPASPRTRAKTPLLQLIVVPRTPALQAAEDALSNALLALVLGTRPPVSPAMILHHLQEHYGIAADRVTVRRTRPDDFIVRFNRQEDLELVLANQRPAGAPFTLRWRRWTRLISGSAGAFRYRALVGLKGIPSHARSEEVARGGDSNTPPPHTHTHTHIAQFHYYFLVMSH
jgi:hypothetical protein